MEIYESDGPMLRRAGELDLLMLVTALEFAARKHAGLLKKGMNRVPFINHPIEVCKCLVEHGRVVDITILAAALLHDTIESSQTTSAELRSAFGLAVEQLVKELTDDKNLPEEERRDIQVKKAPGLSDGARMIRLADKICKLQDLKSLGRTAEETSGWLGWAQRVGAACAGANRLLDHRFNELMAEAIRSSA